MCLKTESAKETNHNTKSSRAPGLGDKNNKISMNWNGEFCVVSPS